MYMQLKKRMEEIYMNKTIAVFGHRKIDEDDKDYLESNVFTLFEQFISRGDKTFLFGSNSEFNDLCYSTITNLQTKYTGIKRIGYLCAREIAFTREEMGRYLKFIENSKQKGRHIKIYEDIIQFEFDNKNLYIERNKKMIDDADICIFYYKEFKKVTNSKGEITNSGTKIALEYVQLQNKQIIIINKFN